MNKRDIPGYENLEWNCGHDWAIPLPEFPVDGVLVQRRWFIPQETPVIPTGWIYQLARGEVVHEYELGARADRWKSEYPEVIN